MPPPASVRSGIVLMIAAVALFGVMDTLIKWLSSRYGAMQIVFFRSLFSLLPLSVVVARAGGIASLATRHPGRHAVRSLCGLIALASIFHAFRFLPLADAYAILFTTPLFLTALSGPLLGERVDARRWGAVGTGFLGVLIVLRPGGGLFAPAALVCLTGSLFYALTLALMRRHGRTETDAAMIFYYTLACAALGGTLMLPDWTKPVGAGDWAVLVAVGVVGGIAQLLLAQAFRAAPASVVAPFEYTGMVWAVLFGWLVFGDLPGAAVIAGAAVVVASGLYVLHRESGRVGP